jgi:pimeloyl-ACP methyl ester carboxylesterase
LLGHSFGGVLAEAYALYQRHLSHLILGSTFASTKELNAALGKMKSEMPAKDREPVERSKPPVCMAKGKYGSADAI